jgi:glycosyltransferase involved in cell wall biosynthesis
VLQQTLPAAEIILVDDCSPDDTFKFLLQLQQEYGSQPIKVLSLPENGGPGLARNHGRKIASHPYIALLDADDAWHPEKLAIQYTWLEAHPQITLVGHRIVVTQSREIPSPPIDRQGIKTHLVSRQQLLFSCKVLTSSWLFKNDAVGDYEDITRYSEDYFLILKTFFNHHQIALMDATLGYFFKPEFSQLGTSGNLWAMEKAQLQAYYFIWRANNISTLELILYWHWSMVKYLRRLAIAGFRRSQTWLKPHHKT